MTQVLIDCKVPPFPHPCAQIGTKMGPGSLDPTPGALVIPESVAQAGSGPAMPHFALDSKWEIPLKIYLEFMWSVVGSFFVHIEPSSALWRNSNQRVYFEDITGVVLYCIHGVGRGVGASSSTLFLPTRPHTAAWYFDPKSFRTLTLLSQLFRQMALACHTSFQSPDSPSLFVSLTLPQSPSLPLLPIPTNPPTPMPSLTRPSALHLIQRVVAGFELLVPLCNTCVEVLVQARHSRLTEQHLLLFV